ncbi:hypothetical protein R3P38DRAFT_2796244 [Favolaschia claudopus]|uniref:Uncharacterized protein n=1 Tax=Favolaschia claudopus TaxID=2862362 RepID=A0AAW0A5S7_9AGAR
MPSNDVSAPHPQHAYAGNVAIAIAVTVAVAAAAVALSLLFCEAPLLNIATDVPQPVATTTTTAALARHRGGFGGKLEGWIWERCPPGVAADDKRFVWQYEREYDES